LPLFCSVKIDTGLLLLPLSEPEPELESTCTLGLCLSNGIWVGRWLRLWLLSRHTSARHCLVCGWLLLSALVLCTHLLKVCAQGLCLINGIWVGRRLRLWLGWLTCRSVCARYRRLVGCVQVLTPAVASACLHQVYVRVLCVPVMSIWLWSHRIRAHCSC
jgi:hypothetical protein